jgi:hypothetical protein
MERSPMVRLLALAVLALLPLAASATEKEARLYEIRIYYAAEGKLEALNSRFRDHTLKLFEKHGMTNHAYFVPEGKNPERKLVYLISHKDMDARNKSFKDFIADPDWVKAYKESEKDGKLVDKIIEVFTHTTDYSPTVKAIDGKHTFELRTYITTPNNLDGINARFRDHTMKLFEKYGMSNLWYFNLVQDVKSKDLPLKKADTLIYFLAHKSTEARNASFDNFRKDPAWIAARYASETKAGGSLTMKDGVKSEMLVPTDYSPLK